MRFLLALTLMALILGCLLGCANTREPNLAPPALNFEQRAAMAAQVKARENAFAKTLADRDFAAFASFIDPEAVFLYGGKPQRGKAEILAAWKGFFEGPTPPFAWRADYVEVDPSGQLAQTKGTVSSVDGKDFAIFWSVWKRNANGEWLVYFDDGCWPGCFPGTDK
jgi:ketosteroid isomerase-like protein